MRSAGGASWRVATAGGPGKVGPQRSRRQLRGQQCSGCCSGRPHPDTLAPTCRGADGLAHSQRRPRQDKFTDTGASRYMTEEPGTRPSPSDVRGADGLHLRGDVRPWCRRLRQFTMFVWPSHASSSWERAWWLVCMGAGFALVSCAGGPPARKRPGRFRTLSWSPRASGRGPWQSRSGRRPSRSGHGWSRWAGTAGAGTPGTGSTTPAGQVPQRSTRNGKTSPWATSCRSGRWAAAWTPTGLECSNPPGSSACTGTPICAAAGLTHTSRGPRPTRKEFGVSCSTSCPAGVLAW